MLVVGGKNYGAASELGALLRRRTAPGGAESSGGVFVTYRSLTREGTGGGGRRRRGRGGEGHLQ